MATIRWRARSAGFINAMTEDEQVDLVALMRLGRGDGTIEEWKRIAPRGGGRTATGAPRAICSASRWSAIIWPKGYELSSA